MVKSRVKEIVKIVKTVAPGDSVELRIPHYAAIQCVFGSVHRRGTSPNVVEMNGDTVLKLVKDPTYLDKHCHEGLISTSGTNANLEYLFTNVSKLDTSSSRGCYGQ